MSDDRPARPSLAGPEPSDAFALLDAVSVAVLATDLSGAVTYANAAAEALYGLSRRRLVGTNVMDVLVDPDSVGRATEIMSMVLSGQQWSGEFPVLCAGGHTRTLRVTDSPMWRDGVVVGVVGVAQPVADLGMEPWQLPAERLAQLARVVGELAAAPDVDAVTEVVVGNAAQAVDAAIASLSLLEDERTLRLVGLRGAPPGAETRWASYSLDEPLPVCDAMRRNETVHVVGGSEIVRRYPGLTGQVPEDRVLVCLPVSVAERRLAVISLSFPGSRSLSQPELEFLAALADACGQALQRVEALAVAADSATRVTFLAEATEEMASSLDYRTTLANVTRLAVPRLADWCVIQLLRDGRLQTLAVAHVDPEKVSLAEELQRRYPPRMDAPTGAPKVVRTGVSELYPDITDELLVAGAHDEEHLRITRELGLRSGLIVPLAARGRVFGVLSLVAAESGRRYGPADREFAEAVARRAAIAIDNADLFTETRQTASLLQQAVLPPLVDLPGWETAAVYEPASRTEVGGDFYDVLPLAGNRLAVIVGDVMGRGVGAAAAMAQVRSALRAYVALDPDPPLVLTRLDRMFATYAYSQLVTLAYLVLDPAHHRVELASAGHLPPLIVRADGKVDPLAGPAALPLGVQPDDRTAVVADFGPGDVVLGYTDGLVERRLEDIDEGLARLTRLAAALTGRPLPDGLSALLTELRDPDSDDDVTVLAARAR